MIHNINALLPKKEDARDFSVAGVFGQIDISEVPTIPFLVNPAITILDQGETDYCSAYAASAVSEDQEDTVFVPEYTFCKTKHLMGDLESWGADLRNTCKALCTYGSIPRGPMIEVPKTREQVLDPKSWESYEYLAQKYRKQTYFTIDGRYDLFDNIRTAMWQNRAEKRSILTGCMWNQTWVDAPDGIIPKEPIAGGFGHAFKICGWDKIGDEVYLIAQLSGGTGVGDDGLYYMPREVVNRELAPYGAYMFKDMARETAEYYNKVGVTFDSPLTTKIVAFIKHKLRI